MLMLSEYEETQSYLRPVPTLLIVADMLCRAYIFFVMALATLSLRKKHHTLLMSCYSNPNPNLIECDENYSGIKTLTFSLHAVRVTPNTALLGSHLTLTLRHVLMSCGVRTKCWPRKKNKNRTTLESQSAQSKEFPVCCRRWFWCPDSANVPEFIYLMSLSIIIHSCWNSTCEPL